MQMKEKRNRTRAAAIFLLTFVTAFTMLMPTSLVSAQQATQADYLPPGGANWNKLRDIEIKDNGWGFGATAAEETYLGQTARKIETSDWWADQLVLNGWQSFDLSPYENGTLEFDIVGKEGGETVTIGFRDVVHERLDEKGSFYKDEDENPEETNIDALVNVNDYISQVTTKWQHVSIPLKKIFDSNPLFDESKIQLLKIAGDNKPITFWISNIKVTSPDAERSYAPIKVNQVGYLNHGEKYAHVSGYYNELSADVGTPFQVKKTSDNSIAYSGTLTLVAAYDELSGEKVLKADFSALNDIGEYYITVDGITEKSVSFEIGPDVYDNLLTDVQRFFYYQRANVDLLPEHAGEFARTGLHKDDENLPLQSNPDVKKDVSGGWWDAGDTGKYVTAAATAVSDLLWAYESFQDEFTDGQLNIPESGNNIPDLLDEIKVETDFFLKMQEQKSGGFYAYVVREPIPNRYIMDGTGSESIIPTSQTATTVGALAHAYIVMKDVPGLETYAKKLLDSAVRGWKYLEAHPEFIAQPDGPYNDNDDLNDRFYAAAALYRATGEAKYSDYVVANYKAFESKFDTTDFSHGIGSLEQIAFYHYMSSAEPSKEVSAWFIPKFREWKNKVIETATKEAVWRNSTNKGFYWGANSNVAGVAVSLDIGSRVIGEYDERMIQVASGNLNYLLGINPLQLSFITGYGENRVHITHHEIYMRDFIKEMPNGYMPGGPNNNGKFNFSAKAYNQATVDWESNEQALNYNSPLIYLTALLSGSGQTTPELVPDSKVDFHDIDALPFVTKDAIRAIAAEGIVVGTEPGKYDPQGKLTRAEFVQMMVNFLNIADPTASSTFTDVKAGAWYYKAVASAEKLGYVQGKADGSFGINDVLTREEMAVLIHRALLASGYSLQTNEQEVPAFVDEADVSAYAQNAVEALKQAKVLVADGNGNFGPQSTVNRADAAVLLYNFLQTNK